MAKNKRQAIPLWMKIYHGEFCTVCKTTENVEYHHIVPVSWGGKTEVDNLMPLCRMHHMQMHALMDDAVLANNQQEYQMAIDKMNEMIGLKKEA